LQAATESGFTVIVSIYSPGATVNDPPPYDRSATLQHFPSGASTSSGSSTTYLQGASTSSILLQIQAQLQTSGFSVVRMTPGEFTSVLNGQYTMGVNQTMIDQLQDLIQTISSAGLKICFLSQILVCIKRLHLLTFAACSLQSGTSLASFNNYSNRNDYCYSYN
jgi:hypothetical protein